MSDHAPDKTEKEGVVETFKVQSDMNGKHLLIYNKDRSIFNQIDDPYVSSFMLDLLELEPMERKYASGRIGEGGEFRIDRILDEADWPDW